MAISDFRPDTDRLRRIGIEEAVFCASKNVSQIEAIVADAGENRRKLLLTRLEESKFRALRKDIRTAIDYEAVSQTGIFGKPESPAEPPAVAVVTAGTSDLSVAREAERTLCYHGVGSNQFYDVGVAGLWRILSIEHELRNYAVVIAVAGMDAALASVIGGLIPSVVVAVPTSVGYGVAQGGRSALESVLTSCAPGLATVNIDNGYGAACLAIRVLKSQRESDGNNWGTDSGSELQ